MPVRTRPLCRGLAGAKVHPSRLGRPRRTISVGNPIPHRRVSRNFDRERQKSQSEVVFVLDVAQTRYPLAVEECPVLASDITDTNGLRGRIHHDFAMTPADVRLQDQ